MPSLTSSSERSAIENGNQKIIAEAQERQAQKLIEMQIQIQSSLFDKAATYNNIVVSLGFAGFLAIWIWARDFLNAWDATLIIFLLGVSLFLFVLWNVVTTFIISKQNISLAKLLSTPNDTATQKVEKIQAYEKQNQKWSLAYYGAWYFIFLMTSLLGFVSGALLIVLIGLKLLGFEAGLHSFFEFVEVSKG